MMTRRQAKNEGLKLHIEILQKLIDRGHTSASPNYQDVHSTIQRMLQDLGGMASAW